MSIHLHVHMYITGVLYIHGGQKRVSDSLETPYRYWKQNPGLLQEQQVFLTTEPFITPAPINNYLKHLIMSGGVVVDIT